MHCMIHSQNLEWNRTYCIPDFQCFDTSQTGRWTRRIQHRNAAKDRHIHTTLIHELVASQKMLNDDT